jgi:transposase
VVYGSAAGKSSHGGGHALDLDQRTASGAWTRGHRSERSELRAISHSDRKSDQVDAEKLARYARLDPEILRPIAHRTVHATRTRTGAWFGTGADQGDDRQDQAVRSTDPTGRPDRVSGDSGTPEVHGVDHITALTYVLTLGSKERFRQSHDAACYLGLRSRRSQSGDRDPQLGITKAGNVYLRSLLIECANYILRPHGRDSSTVGTKPGVSRWQAGEEQGRRCGRA